MATVMLFGSSTIFGVPSEVIEWLNEYNKQGHKFIVGDNKGACVTFHKALSSIGANDVTIYAMDNARNNLYEYPVKSFITNYDEATKKVEITTADSSVEPYIIDDVEKVIDIPHNRQWYEYRDKQLINDCDIAIGLWDGESKKELHIIQLMNILNKPCYTFTLKV
jgi:hypothetical protein